MSKIQKPPQAVISSQTNTSAPPMLDPDAIRAKQPFSKTLSSGNEFGAMKAASKLNLQTDAKQLDGDTAARISAGPTVYINSVTTKDGQQGQVFMSFPGFQPGQEKIDPNTSKSFFISVGDKVYAPKDFASQGHGFPFSTSTLWSGAEPRSWK
jgi:hypothetical protein